MVKLLFFIVKVPFKRMVPPTSKTMILPGFETASANEPAPFVLRFVTWYTVGDETPRAPSVYLPPPSAPGNAGILSAPKTV